MRRREQPLGPITAALLLMLATLLSAGCGGVALEESLRSTARFPDQARVEGVPFYPQEKNQCGPAALAMVLSWSGLSVQPEDLVAATYTSKRKGSLQSDLIAASRRHGRLAYPFHGPDLLLAEIAAGRPVIVLLNLAFSWYPQWHYAVVIGYDRNGGALTLHSGTKAAEQMSLRLFDKLWKRSDYWALSVLPPSETVARPDEEKWLEAIVGLERAWQWQAAAVAYGKAAQLWPHSHNAWIGLGNTRHRLGDPAGAAAAFREAIRVQPASGIACNNLAQVLLETGQYQEAEQAARQAVSLGGPLRETFLRTLNEVTAGGRDTPRDRAAD
ncbi:MAG TPA: bacteriocin-processing peptidase family protein [Desulfobacteraceae bacterium]|nr:bacteriocin-processing peptidase family protein [Desulfobacteraceae bacterium]